MAKRGFSGRVMKWAMAAALGGSLFQLGGCDPTVRSTILSGLQTTTTTLTSTLINAFFLSLANDDTGSTSLTTP